MQLNKDFRKSIDALYKDDYYLRFIRQNFSDWIEEKWNGYVIPEVLLQELVELCRKRDELLLTHVKETYEENPESLVIDVRKMLKDEKHFFQQHKIKQCGSNGKQSNEGIEMFKKKCSKLQKELRQYSENMKERSLCQKHIQDLNEQLDLQRSSSANGIQHPGRPKMEEMVQNQHNELEKVANKIDIKTKNISSQITEIKTKGKEVHSDLKNKMKEWKRQLQLAYVDLCSSPSPDPLATWYKEFGRILYDMVRIYETSPWMII
ncbi:hypothetical protein ScPMuIL_010632 [Solemya velum]